MQARRRVAFERISLSPSGPSALTRCRRPSPSSPIADTTARRSAKRSLPRASCAEITQSHTLKIH